MTENFEQYLDWIVYQIYPKSFFDSNGDGIGDINGIAEKLNYIKGLGANAIWICPMYESPQCDNGYDISDYRSFQKEYGTMADFERLISKAHSLGIRVIMDLVANHTSDLHPWFQEARKSRNNPYHDYYYWADKPLNDWKSCFGGSAWEFNEATNEYYLHSFAVGQPDVNWKNPRVRSEFISIVDFWAEKGVDGFRCDVLDFIAKDFNHNLMMGGKHFHEYVNELFGREKVKKLFTVGECSADEKSIKDLCGETRGELKCSFQFEHIGLGRVNKYMPKPHSVFDTAKVLKKWQEFSQDKDFLYTLFTDNHDQPWYNSRMGNDKEYRYESATLLAAMFFAARGVPFIYQGQEIGAANSFFESIKDFDDIETINYYHEHRDEYSESELMQKVNYGSRDNPRRPMAWTGERGCGFTEAEKPWLPFATRSKEINVQTDETSEKSVLLFYRKLLRLRNASDVLRRGSYETLHLDTDYYAYCRREKNFEQFNGSNYKNEEYIIICNFEKESHIAGYSEDYECVLTNYAARNGETRAVNGCYAPYECAVFKKHN